MNVESLSQMLAAIIMAALSIAMLIRNPASRLHTSFSLLTGVLFCFYLASFVFGVSDAGAWYRLSILASLALPPASLRFFTIFLQQQRGLGRKATQVSVTLALLLAPFVFSDLIKRDAVRLLVLAFVISALLVCMFALFERLRRTKSRVEAARLKYLFWGGLVAVLFSVMDYIPSVDAPWLAAIGNTITVIYTYFLSQIIIQYRLLDLNELIGKMLVLAFLVTMLAAVYSVIGFFVEDIPGLIFINTFIGGFVILILFDPINRLIEDKVNRLLFRERYEFGRQLALLRRELANIVDVDQMVELTLQRLEKSRRITGASIYLLSESGDVLRCAGNVGPPPVEVIETVAERPFLERIRDARTLIVESLDAEQRDLLMDQNESALAQLDVVREITRVMDCLAADVSVPLLSEDHVVGLLNVRDDRMRDAYSPEEIGNFIAIANQATICIENSRIVRSIRDRDRLAAVGEMAAGLAHEIRNPLGAIKGAAQMLAEDPSDPQELTEFLEIIVEEVNRLNKVVSAFLNYAKPYGGAQGPSDCNTVIEKVLTLLRSSASEAQVEIEVSLAANLPPVHIDGEVLRQVLLNLGLNALEALTDSSGNQMFVRTRVVGGGRRLLSGYFRHDLVEIEVRDTGPGISANDLERIFLPFFTTKAQGTGLGLAICQRLVRAAGGDIEVLSSLGAGATFVLRLPLWSDETLSTSERLRAGKPTTGTSS